MIAKSNFVPGVRSFKFSNWRNNELEVKLPSDVILLTIDPRRDVTLVLLGKIYKKPNFINFQKLESKLRRGSEKILKINHKNL